jgi:hypothetical protein
MSMRCCGPRVRQMETAREQAVTLQTELDRIRQSFQCQICCINDVDQILAPCGHLLCTEVSHVETIRR